MTWLVITNSHHCNIYDFSQKPKTLTLLKELLHPASMLQDRDLSSDKPGHYRAHGTAHGAFVPRQDPKENEIIQFSRAISKELEAGRKSNRFENIILVAPSHVIGLIHQHLDSITKKLITREILKDYTQLNEEGIWEELKKDLLPEKSKRK